MSDSRYNRRDFINLTSPALAALAFAPELSASRQTAPAQPAGTGVPAADLIVINARVYTMDGKRSTANVALSA